MMIPEHKIEEVLSRIDLVGLVSRHVELKKSGRSYKGKCPFHQDKSPSFYVTPEMRRFKCFGCEAGGDAIAFVQRYFGKSFVDAVRDLAREAGVDLAGAEDPTAQERAQLKAVTDLAFEHFRSQLWDEAHGKEARRYLESRGVAVETARAFGLGWAPAEWESLAKVLLAHGVLEHGVKAGLVAPRTKGEGYYDVFRGRLMVPIRSPEGRPIAFGGRLLVGDQGPKYLNSRESRLYNKSETLYGLDQAREEIRRTRTAVLVEGYFDCIGLHQAGVKNAVALCSTALTPGHLALLTRSEAKELVMLLDGDEAGRKAVERLAGALLAAGTPTKVALLPEGEDPDTFARSVGGPKVRQLLEQASPLSQHLFLTALPKGAEAAFEEKMAALQRLKPIAAALPVGLFRSAFISALARHSGLPAAELEATLHGKPPEAVKPVPKPSGRAEGPLSAPKAPERPPDALEAYFAACVLKEPRLLSRDVHRCADELRHPGLRSAVAALGQNANPADVREEASPALRRAVEGPAQQLPQDAEALAQAFEAICGRLKLRSIDERLRYLARAAGQVAGPNDLSDDVRRLQEERIALLALKQRVLRESAPAKPGTKRIAQSV